MFEDLSNWKSIVDAGSLFDTPLLGPGVLSFGPAVRSKNCQFGLK